MPGPERLFSQTPAIDTLVGMGYEFRSQEANELARDGLNQVLLRDELIAAVQRLNDVPEETALATYNDLLRVTDNERWTRLLRGDYSRSVPGQTEKRTIRLIDFRNPANNTFTVTEELVVEAEKTRRADLVIYVNGVPLVVIECKSPLAYRDKSGQAFDQIKQYEEQIPRLFYSNAFSVVTNGVHTLYGATGAASEHWSVWKDPWPRTEKDFASDFEKSLWCLLEPARLLDILAHFLVFERDPTTGKSIKKMCRYQQFRAVNKIVDRVVEGKHKRGLVWHTQGSGKSLTMVYAALKLKTHRTLDAPALANPNLLVLTDRIQLDDQIAATFEACGVRNAKQIKRGRRLLDELYSAKKGLTLLSMIFKFDKSTEKVANSEDWIVLVDECHRTQEKDLGAYLRATLPEARFFGFTGTPVKKNDHDTYANFGAPGEGYLDRYSIDNAVADGATVPIRYTGRKTEWHLEGREIDILFDQKFADLSDKELAELKGSGATFARLAKHADRIKANAFDIWTHYRLHAFQDGFKAQIATLDREALVLYKEALDEILAKYFEKHEGLSPEAAAAKAEAFTACVYTSNQEDDKPSEDHYVARVRKLLRRNSLNDQQEKELIKAFKKKGQPPYMLIVCDKLLTGFDAPIESVMYLDKPLKEHNLLQAIARTNRVAPLKQFGLIVDYIGVTRNLDEALASYRREDVANALRDLDELEATLKEAHAEVRVYLDKVRRKNGRPWRERLKDEYDALIQELRSEDEWFRFEVKGKRFIKAYEALSPEPVVLSYTEDLKWVGGFLPYGRLHFEEKGDPSFADHSADIREMLEEHLSVTGIKTVCKLRRLTDPDFFVDFGKARESDEQELKTAAVRKTAELKKEIADRVADNTPRYEKSSQRLMEILRRFDEGLLSVAEKVEEMERLAREVQAEDQAHKTSGLSKEAFGVLRILEAHCAHGVAVENLDEAARGIAGLYESDATAPPGWTRKSQLRKELRQQVRRLVFGLGLENWKDIPGEVDKYAEALREGVATVPTLRVGKTDVPYAVRFSEKAKRTRLAVSADGQVEAVAPAGTAPETVEAFVARKRKWVVQSLETVRARPRVIGQPQRFASGAKLLYRGRRLMLKVERAPVEGVEIECRSRFSVRTPARWSAARQEREIATAFEAWLRERAAADIGRLARRYAAALGVEMRAARVGDQKGMWGTCGRDRVVRVNWRLVQAPLAALEYVVAHEVCHLVHRSHGEQFLATLTLLMPDWEERKRLLEGWEAEHQSEGALA